MPKADGEIIIDTHIDTEGIEKDADKLFDKTKKMATEVAESTSKMFNKVDPSKLIQGTSKASYEMARLNMRAHSVEEAIDNLSIKMAELSQNPFATDNQKKYYSNFFRNLKNEEKRLDITKELYEETGYMSKKEIASIINEQKATDRLVDSINKIIASSQKLGSITTYDDLQKKVQQLPPEYKKLETQIAQVTNKMIALGNVLKNNSSQFNEKELQNFVSQYNQLNKTLNMLNIRRGLPILDTPKKENLPKKEILDFSNDFRQAFQKIGSVASNVFDGIRNKAQNVFSNIGNWFSRITRRAQWILIGQTIRKVIAEAGQSFIDLQTYSAPFSQTVQSLTDSFKRLANSIVAAVAPVLQALAPIIINIANAITTLMNKIAMFTSALFTGAKTATIANTNFTGYSKSVAKTTKNTRRATKAAKEQYKALAKFDKLDVFKRDKKPQTSPAAAATEMPRPQALDMFKEVAIPNNILDFANKLKETFAPLAEEFKVIGDSFQKNFAQPVMEHIRGNFLPRFFESTKKTLKEIDFTNLNNSLDHFFKVCAKFTIKFFKGLSWAWEEIFLPMSKWAAEQYFPAFLDHLSAAIELLDSVIEAASPALKSLLKWAIDIAEDVIIAGFKADIKCFEGMRSAIKLLGEALRIVQPYLQKTLDWSKSIVKDYIREGLTAFSNAINGIKWAIDGVSYAISSARPNIQGFLNIIEPIANTLREIVKFMLPGYGLFKAFNQLSWAAKTFHAIRTGDTGALFDLANNVPQLASGTVVSPNRKFLAMLGDNAYEPEVVSPISTMKRAFSEAINENNIQGGTGNITLQIDGKTFARLINPYMSSEQNRVGISMIQGVY